MPSEVGVSEAKKREPVARVFVLGKSLGIHFYSSLMNKVAGANLLGALLVLVLTIASFSGIGIISASFVMVFKRGDPLAFAFSGASYLLGGVYYPVAVLPSWLQKISYLLPIRHSLEGIRLCLLGRASLKMIAPNLIALLCFTAVLPPSGLLCFQRAVRRANMDGSLTHY